MTTIHPFAIAVSRFRLACAAALLALAACSTVPPQPDAPPVAAPPPKPPAAASPRALPPPPPPAIPTPEAEAARGPEPAHRIRFAENDDAPTAEGTRALAEVARYMRENARAGLVLRGHSGESGSRELNVARADRSATQVKKLLAELGVPERRMTTASYGVERTPQLARGTWVDVFYR